MCEALDYIDTLVRAHRECGQALNDRHLLALRIFVKEAVSAEREACIKAIQVLPETAGRRDAIQVLSQRGVK